MAGALYFGRRRRGCRVVFPVAVPVAVSEGRPLVLVVDDFEDNRSMYAMYLTYSGYDVLEAGDGQEAVEVASRQMPDVIVMDVRLLGGLAATAPAR